MLTARDTVLRFGNSDRHAAGSRPAGVWAHQVCQGVDEVLRRSPSRRGAPTTRALLRPAPSPNGAGVGVPKERLDATTRPALAF